MSKKIALITGASAGIGLEFARIFAREGYELVLVARRGEALRKLAEELKPVRTLILEKDLSAHGSGEALYREVKSQGIEIDVLVNNAGFGDFGFFNEADLTTQLRMIDLNVRSLTELTHLFGKDMIARRNGKILNVASTAAFQPGPRFSVYYATKHFVLAFSEGIANEWKESGVTVTALCPGPTKSEFMQVAKMGDGGAFKNLNMPTSLAVAEYGYRAMLNGKTVAVHGFVNRIMIFLVKFFPRGVVTRIVRKIQDGVAG